MAYTLVALFTDLVFDLYKEEFERMEGMKLKKPDQIIPCKKKIFQDLMPIGDDYVMYTDFSDHFKSTSWSNLFKAMRTYLNLQID